MLVGLGRSPVRTEGPISRPVQELLHQHFDDGLNVHPVRDRGNRTRVWLTVDARVELMCSSQGGSPAARASAPDDDASWSDTAVTDALVSLMVESRELICDHVVRDLAAVMRISEAHAYPVRSGTEMMPARKSGVSLIDKARQARSYAESGIEVAGTLRVHVLSACEARDLS